MPAIFIMAIGEGVNCLSALTVELFVWNCLVQQREDRLEVLRADVSLPVASELAWGKTYFSRSNIENANTR